MSFCFPGTLRFLNFWGVSGDFANFEFWGILRFFDFLGTLRFLNLFSQFNSWGELQVANQFVWRSSGSQFNSWGKNPGRGSIRGEEFEFVGGSPRSQLERQFVWGRAPGRSSIRGEELQFVGEEPQVAVHFVGRRANSWGRAPGHRFMCERSFGHRFLTRRGIMRFLFFWGLCDF